MNRRNLRNFIDLECGTKVSPKQGMGISPSKEWESVIARTIANGMSSEMYVFVHCKQRELPNARLRFFGHEPQRVPMRSEAHWALGSLGRKAKSDVRQ